jgi:dihydrofolate reductase
MGDVVLFMSVSVDGFAAGPNDELGWQLVDEEVHTHFNDVLRPAGAFVSGRRAFEMLAAFWPTADADPSNSPAVIEFAGIWREKPKIVYSRTLEGAGWDTRIVREVVPSEVEALKREFDGDLSLGGIEIARVFRRLDLIDQYRLYVHPVVLGRGKSLFEPSDRRDDLALAETRAFGNGVVLLRYRRR